MKKNSIETLLGLFVIIVAGLFVVYAGQRIDARPEQGYALSAVFMKSGGLQSGSDVRISGIKVGSVTEIELTPDYTARVTMNIKKSIPIPADSVAAVVTDGLMGGSLLSIEPGKSTNLLKDGDKISNTRDFRSMENIISDVIFMATGTED